MDNKAKPKAKAQPRFIPGFRPGMTLKELDELRYPSTGKALTPAQMENDVTPPASVLKKFGCGGKVKMAKGGSVCRGGGAATRGTKFRGVK